METTEKCAKLQSKKNYDKPRQNEKKTQVNSSLYVLLITEKLSSTATDVGFTKNELSMVLF